MNWIERMYELKGKDLYSQNGEGLYLEYIFNSIPTQGKSFVDIGGSDGFYLSNTRHLKNIGSYGYVLDQENGHRVNVENLHEHFRALPQLLSIDTDGNDYWLLEDLFNNGVKPSVILAEFNPAFLDYRAIKYNPDHVWDGTDYYGFSFAAGQKLAERFGYKVIFQTGNMNMFMVRADLVNVEVPPVKFEQVNFFEKSNRTDWVMI